MRRFDVSGPAICMKFRPRSNGGRSAPLWGAAEGRAFAFFAKYDDSVPAYMDSVYNYIHFASIWYDFPDYEDNSLFIPARAISDSREIYQDNRADFLAPLPC